MTTIQDPASAAAEGLFIRAKDIQHSQPALSIAHAHRLDADSAAVMGLMPQPSPRSILAFSGPAGEFISQGKSWSLDAPAQCGAAAGTLEFQAAGAEGSSWLLSLASADGQALQVGTHGDARRAAFRGSCAGLSLSGDGRGANVSFGSFSILEIERDDSGAVTKIAVDFEQRSEQPHFPALTGSLRIKSSIPSRQPGAALA